ncbi:MULTISPECIES: ABC transporter substrate-binding protein [Bacillus]|uniref:ABC transporter substrate-binding protein n=1 Tax=Bacillus TaxID=1386 RepID=UPI0002ED2FE1|nr:MULTISPECIES: sugar ABC transporter substrate-binding protein [Bacillus]
MKLFKKIVIPLLSASVILGIVGCSKDSSTNEKTSNDKKQVEITWWNYPNWDALDGELGKYEKEVIKAFNKKNPTIKVNLEMISFEGGPEKVNVALASKTAPDLIYDAPGRILDYGEKGYLAPLNDMVDSEMEKDISESIWNQSKVKDDVVMYPLNTTPFMMAVNKTLFEKIGALDLLPLDRPERTWSVAEYEKALEAVKTKAPDVYPSAFFAKSSAGDQGTRAYLANLAGNSFLNKDMTEVTINSGDGAKALQWVVDGVSKKLVAPGAESMAASDTLDLFLQGKLATTINYSTVVKKIYSSKKVVDFEEAFVSWPTPDGTNPSYEPYIGGMAVFNNGDKDKIEAAKKLINFIANDPEWKDKNLKATGGFSVRNSVTGLYDDAEMTYVESMRKYIIDGPTRAKGFVELRTVWFPELQQALMGKSSPKKALDSFKAKGDEILKKSQ